MQLKTLSIIFFLVLAIMAAPQSLLGSSRSEKQVSIEKEAPANHQKLKGSKRINQEDVRPGKKEMRMDGLSMAAHIATVTGLAELFLIPALGLVSIISGFVMGLIAWKTGKRYEHRRGRGLAIASMALGGVIVLLVGISLVAFFLTFGIF